MLARVRCEMAPEINDFANLPHFAVAGKVVPSSNDAAHREGAASLMLSPRAQTLSTDASSIF